MLPIAQSRKATWNPAAYEADPKKVWSVDDDDQGHGNMDHSAMPGKKMN